jgi:hypothetical protein
MGARGLTAARLEVLWCLAGVAATTAFWRRPARKTDTITLSTLGTYSHLASPKLSATLNLQLSDFCIIYDLSRTVNRTLDNISTFKLAIRLQPYFENGVRREFF